MSRILADAAALIRQHAPADRRTQFDAVAVWLDAEADGDRVNPVSLLTENLDLTVENDRLRAELEERLAESADPDDARSSPDRRRSTMDRRVRHSW
jgi:regulator of replication initiation timing